MKKTVAVIALICFSFLFSLPSTSSAFWGSDVKKAKQFMQAGMYPQAIALLEKRINDKPTDAEAHFQLGICYTNIGNYTGADERFASTARLKPDYGYKIGGEFKKAGTAALNKGQATQAKDLFSKAVKYQPNLKQEIATECFNAGISALNKGDIKTANSLFSAATKYQPGLSKSIATECLKRGENSGFDGYFRLAKYHNPALAEQIADYYAAKGDIESLQKARWYSEKYNAVLSKKLTIRDFELSLQRYIEKYGPPTRTEELNKDKWITILADPNRRDKVFYLSLESFLARDDGGVAESGSAIQKRKVFDYTAYQVPNGPLEFKRKDKSTTVYIWIDKDE